MAHPRRFDALDSRDSEVERLRSQVARFGGGGDMTTNAR